MKNVLKIIFIVALFAVVLIVFLSYQSSREVLKAFNEINVRLIHANDSLHIKEKYIYQELDYNSVDSLKINLIDNADKLRYEIELIKNTFLTNVNIASPEVMDNTDVTNSVFFNETGVSKNGINFLNALGTYKESINPFWLEDNPQNYLSIINDFPANENKRRDWLVYNFKDFPAISSIAKLTSLQNDVLQINALILETRSNN